MRSLSDLFPFGQRRHRDARDRLEGAYKATFTGRGSKEDAEIVLSDLLAFSGLFDVSDDLAALPMREGRRQMAYRILRFLDLSHVEKRAMAEAAARESFVNDAEGRL